MTQPLRVPAIQFFQKDVRMYLFSLSGSTLDKLFKTHPKTSQDEAGIQRTLDPKRLKEIALFVGTTGNLLPNSIVVNLTDEVHFEPSEIPDVGHLLFPSHEGRYGILLDGQHRLFGVVHEDSTEKNLQLAVTGLFLSDRVTAAKVFVSINDNQKPVKKNLLIALQHELGLLPTPQENAAAITEKLNEDSDSPLKGRIQMYQDQKGSLRNDQMINILATHLLQPTNVLAHYSVNTASAMLKTFLSAISEMFPNAWADDKKHLLVRPAGMEVLLPLYEHARERTGVLMPIKEQFTAALEPLRDTRWDAKTFRENRYTNSAGRRDLRNVLLNKLMITE
ncbi:DGQHR domain-containing protein [Aggregatilinea lenta]|uniref:DGQHR domain-containing protein n=1 Tax=Aggregatilinea lenta TaxID=913108 RepID=UPI000E5AE66B|nr:DGQHR domain-containing protein [Aggregatilinea lenta]